MQAEIKSAFTSTVAFWISQIDAYDQNFQPWEKRSKEIIDRYRDERKGANKNKARFNILWSNVQTLSPALYATPPKVNIDRRFQDDDDIGRYSALVLERATMYYVNQDLFDNVMRQMVLDRLLPGRGTPWIRYVPTFKEVEQITDDATMQSEDGKEEPEQELYSEDVVPDYVHWQDFGHTWARTWQEVRGVWRKVYLSRAELVKRFGTEIGNQIQLDAKPRTDDGKDTESGKKATIYEIWDKTKKKALWIHRDHSDVLDERDDPLRLKDFFPCPKPLYATLTNDNLIPVPDFIQYQDQARELDMLTGRIDSITKALKVAGVYAANAQGIDRLLTEGVENKLIPVDQWAAFAEKGGLAGVFVLLPMQEIMQTLIGLYDSRERVKNDLYEITGISDVIRGSTNAAETATAQQLKGQYASLRLNHMQGDVSRIARDMVRIMAEIIAEHFSMDTIKQVSGIKLLTQAEKQQIQMSQPQAPVQPGAAPTPPPPPLPEEIQELMELPTWEEIEQIIRNDTARCFRIDIETDSTIKTDQEAEKAARTEFLAAAGGFIQQMVQVPNPELQPLLMEMLMFGVRGFKVSRELETTFDSVLNKIKKAAENPAPPQPDPEMERLRFQADLDQKNMQAKGQQDQMKMQFEGQKMQQEKALADQTLALEQQKLFVEQEKIKADVKKTQIDAKTKVSSDVAMADADLNEGEPPLVMMMTQLANSLNQGLGMIAEIQAQGNQAVIQAIQNPPPRQVIRDANGQISGVQ
jgi:hypothetical protein